MELQTGSPAILLLSTLELGLIAAVGYFLSIMVGSPDTNNNLVKTVLPVTGILGAIVMLHTLMWYFYFIHNPLSMNLYFLISGSMTMIISLIALSISIVTKS